MTPLLTAGLGLVALLGGHAFATEGPTYSMEATVRIEKRDPEVARVRWRLAGIDEIVRFRIELPDDRITRVKASGRLERKGSELEWTPGGPYGTLDYRVALRHRRSPTSGYDAYATETWGIARAQDLFPRTHVTFDTAIEAEPRSRTTIRFDVPSRWKTVSTMESSGRHVYEARVPGKRHNRPKGWLAWGNLEIVTEEISETEFLVATAPESDLSVERLLDMLRTVYPQLQEVLEARPERLVIVSGPDPMWRGALSGEESLFVHGSRPVRSKDRTSTPLHELFHVLAPFRPDNDGTWVTEGLAEYYSLELQRRSGSLSEEKFLQGLRLLREQGEWDVDLTRDGSLAVVNNAAPFVVAAIDERIRSHSGGERSLDDAVRILLNSSERVSTASFLRAVNEASRLNFAPFFRRTVYAGRVPPLETIEPRATAAAGG